MLPQYTTPTFIELKKELANSGFEHTSAVFKSRLFWRLQPECEYKGEGAKSLLDAYSRSLLREYETRLAKHSLAYWLHCFRRLPIFPVDEREVPMTRMLRRAALEAAIQRFAHTHEDPIYVKSTECSVSDVLRGRMLRDGLLENEFRSRFGQRGQYVLTDFGIEEFRELVLLDALSYELWTTAAWLRGIAKGAQLVVSESYPYVWQEIDEFLSESFRIFDNRDRGLLPTAKGVVWKRLSNSPRSFVWAGHAYNVEGSKILELMPEFVARKLLKVLPVDMPFQGICPPFFPTIPFEPKSFWGAHEPLSGAFHEKHGVAAATAFAVLIWVMDNMTTNAIFDNHGHGYMSVGYEGPYEKVSILNYIQNDLPEMLRRHRLPFRYEEIDIEKGLDYWTLDREKVTRISLLTPGPFFVFLPSSDNRLFIDYAWIPNAIQHFFYGVKLSDENFKGDLFEELIAKHESKLRRTRLTAEDGTSRQIDFAFGWRQYLFIVECKIKERSFALELGDFAASDMRLNFVSQILEEVDDKADWLRERPRGRNYDVTAYSRIVGVGLSAFVEYVPKSRGDMWLTTELPRVLVPSELEDLMSSDSLKEKVVSEIDKSLVREISD